MSEYDADILEWSEHQAALLRRAAAGERVNDLDWPNIIDEVESAGREQLHKVESLLTEALLHMLEVMAWPASRDVPHWRREVKVFRQQARRRFTPSMRRKLDLDELYADARGLLDDRMDEQPGLPVPELCPYTLDRLLAADIDLMDQGGD